MFDFHVKTGPNSTNTASVTTSTTKAPPRIRRIRKRIIETERVAPTRHVAWTWRVEQTPSGYLPSVRKYEPK